MLAEILMKALEQKILQEGKVYPGSVLKVGGFLNHKIDVPFMFLMADEVYSCFCGDNVTQVLTVEASGIAFGTAIAYKLGVPLTFAKKSKTSNISRNVYSSKVHSYTHGNDYDMVVEKPLISDKDNILIADDFLANGCAVEGLIDIVKQAGATLKGVAIAIEKGFQGGGDKLRKEGVKLLSLAVVDKMSDEGKITFGSCNLKS